MVELEVQKPLSANIGFAGPQKNMGSNLLGGATQAELLIPMGEKRTDYLKPISAPKKLMGE